MNDTVRIDLNADLGEGGPNDLELLAVVSSCNIACGGHAGSTERMATVVRHAKSRRVAIGAHPSYPDRASFGRTSHYLSGEPLEQSLRNQIAALQAIVDAAGQRLAHVKPHGALYSDAAHDASLAGSIASVVQAACPGAALVGAPNSALQRAAGRTGIRFIAEGFTDRAYRPDGSLVPRSEPNAVHADINTITTQAVTLAIHGKVTAENGAVIDVPADTLCIHGDTPNAAQIARAVYEVLAANGVVIRAFD